MKALVVAESADHARELCAGARTMADTVELISFGEVPDSSADVVLEIDAPSNSMKEDAADTVAKAVCDRGANIVLFEATRSLKIIAGKVAFENETSAISGANTFVQGAAAAPFFGGVAECLQKPKGEVAVYVVAAGAFQGMEARGQNTVEKLEWVEPSCHVELVSEEELEKQGADLSSCDVVVAAGRGFTSKDDLKLAYDLAGALDGEVGCSRPLAEGDCWMPRKTYIGVTGQVVSPKVYVAIGISGQMQHLTGCNRSKTFFAINRDESAPIFKNCDYGLVGDLTEVLPAILKEL